jgi:hypothetical protein
MTVEAAVGAAYVLQSLACTCLRAQAAAQVERLPVPELAEEGNERYSSSTTTGGEAREAWGAGHKVDEGLAARLDHACPP